MGEAARTLEPVRERLPDERGGMVWKLVIGRKETVDEIIEHAIEEKETPTPSIIEAYLISGEYPDGRLGEIFIVPGKEGSLMRALLDGFATVVSISLQFGVPLEAIIRKFINTRFSPQGMTNDEQVPMATSIFDLICRKLALKYLDEQALKDLGVEDHRQKTLQLVDEGLCAEAGGNSDGEEHRQAEDDWEIEEGWRLVEDKEGQFLVNEQATCNSRRSGPADFAETGEGGNKSPDREQGGTEAVGEAGEAEVEVPAQTP